MNIFAIIPGQCICFQMLLLFIHFSQAQDQDSIIPNIASFPDNAPAVADAFEDPTLTVSKGNETLFESLFGLTTPVNTYISDNIDTSTQNSITENSNIIEPINTTDVYDRANISTTVKVESGGNDISTQSDYTSESQSTSSTPTAPTITTSTTAGTTIEITTVHSNFDPNRAFEDTSGLLLLTQTKPEKDNATSVNQSLPKLQNVPMTSPASESSVDGEIGTIIKEKIISSPLFTDKGVETNERTNVSSSELASVFLPSNETSTTQDSSSSLGTFPAPPPPFNRIPETTSTIAPMALESSLTPTAIESTSADVSGDQNVTEDASLPFVKDAKIPPPIQTVPDTEISTSTSSSTSNTYNILGETTLPTDINITPYTNAPIGAYPKLPPPINRIPTEDTSSSLPVSSTGVPISDYQQLTTTSMPDIAISTESKIPIEYSESDIHQATTPDTTVTANTYVPPDSFPKLPPAFESSTDNDVITISSTAFTTKMMPTTTPSNKYQITTVKEISSTTIDKEIPIISTQKTYAVITDVKAIEGLNGGISKSKMDDTKELTVKQLIFSPLKLPPPPSDVFKREFGEEIISSIVQRPTIPQIHFPIDPDFDQVSPKTSERKGKKAKFPYDNDFEKRIPTTKQKKEDHIQSQSSKTRSRFSIPFSQMRKNKRPRVKDGRTSYAFIYNPQINKKQMNNARPPPKVIRKPVPLTNNARPPPITVHNAGLPKIAMNVESPKIAAKNAKPLNIAVNNAQPPPIVVKNSPSQFKKGLLNELKDLSGIKKTIQTDNDKTKSISFSEYEKSNNINSDTYINPFKFNPGIPVLGLNAARYYPHLKKWLQTKKPRVSANRVSVRTAPTPTTPSKASTLPPIHVRDSGKTPSSSPLNLESMPPISVIDSPNSRNVRIPDSRWKLSVPRNSIRNKKSKKDDLIASLEIWYDLVRNDLDVNKNMNTLSSKGKNFILSDIWNKEKKRPVVQKHRGTSFPFNEEILRSLSAGGLENNKPPINRINNGGQNSLLSFPFSEKNQRPVSAGSLGNNKPLNTKIKNIKNGKLSFPFNIKEKGAVSSESFGNNKPMEQRTDTAKRNRTLSFPFIVSGQGTLSAGRLGNNKNMIFGTNNGVRLNRVPPSTNMQHQLKKSDPPPIKVQHQPKRFNTNIQRPPISKLNEHNENNRGILRKSILDSTSVFRIAERQPGGRKEKNEYKFNSDNVPPPIKVNGYIPHRMKTREYTITEDPAVVLTTVPELNIGEPTLSGPVGSNKKRSFEAPFPVDVGNDPVSGDPNQGIASVLTQRQPTLHSLRKQTMTQKNEIRNFVPEVTTHPLFSTTTTTPSIGTTKKVQTVKIREIPFSQIRKRVVEPHFDAPFSLPKPPPIKVQSDLQAIRNDTRDISVSGIFHQNNAPPPITTQPPTTAETSTSNIYEVTLPEVTPVPPKFAVDNEVVRKLQSESVLRDELPPSVCHQCHYVGNLCFMSEAGVCNRFVECHRNGDKVRAYEKECALGNFWDPKALACQKSQYVDCKSDPCKNPAVQRHPFLGRCRAYWACSRNTSEPKCCAENYRYSGIGETCVKDFNCKDTCSFPTENSVVDALPKSCPLKAISGDLTHFTDGFRKQQCAPGTRFDQDQCTCIRSNIKPDGEVCNPDTLVDFNGGNGDAFLDKSGNMNGIGESSVLLRNNTGLFYGTGKVSLWRYANVEMGPLIAIQVRFLPYGHSRSPMGLLSNCNGSPIGSTVDIRLDTKSREATFKLSTVRKLNNKIKLPFQPFKWNTATFIYTGNTFTAAINGETRTISVEGSIPNRHPAIQVGGCNRKDGYRGYVDDITVYNGCIPEDFEYIIATGMI